MNRDKTCKLCNAPVETLKHFIFYCNALQEFRVKFVVLQLPRPENIENLLCNILLFKSDLGLDNFDTIDMIAYLWGKRCNLIENIVN